MTATVITILASRVTEVLAEIRKLAAKAKKFGNEDIIVTFGDRYLKEFLLPSGEKKFIEVFDTTITGEAPVVPGGWTLCGQVEFMHNADGENLIHNFTDTPLDPRFRTHKNTCEHCLKKRTRNSVFVFKGETGIELAVGTACLQDFMGGNDPKSILLRAQFFKALFQVVIDEEREIFGYIAAGYGLRDVLAYTAAEIERKGWVSRTAVKVNGGNATADVVAWEISGRPTLTVTDAHYALADETITYFRAMSYTGNEYLDNVRVLMREDVASMKHFGIVCSGVNHVLNEKAKAATMAAQAAVSNYVGAVGDKLKGLKVTVTEAYGYTGDYGPGVKYSFVDATGNVLVWFTGGCGINKGDIITIDGKIKAQRPYKNVKQTILSHVKVKETVVA